MEGISKNVKQTPESVKFTSEVRERQNKTNTIYNKYFIPETILYISSNITNNLVSLLPPRNLILLS